MRRPIRHSARARTHIREARPRYRVEKQRGLDIASAFFAASRSGDMTAFAALLAEDVSLHSDGGGKRPAAVLPILGLGNVLKVHKVLAAIFRRRGSELVRVGLVSGVARLHHV